MTASVDLDHLAKLLADPRLPRQKEIAAALGVDQGFISHVRNRQVKRVTSRIIALEKYVVSYLDPKRPVQQAVDRYLSRGGDPALLVKQVALLEAAQKLRASA